MQVEFPRRRGLHEYPRAGWFAVGTVCFGSFMSQLDAGIVLQAFPAMQRQFGEPLAAVQWVSLSYLLVLTGSLAVAGRVADAVGRELMYVCGFGVFTMASVSCGVAPGLGWLVGLRAVQALGAAMLQANSVALVVTSVPRARMRTALAVQTAAQALGLATGPALGGWLVTAEGWRWVFWVNAPVGIAGILAGRLALTGPSRRAPLSRFDGAGAVLLAVASTAGMLGLSGVSGLAMPGWLVAALLLAAGPAAVAFGWRERRAASPLLRPAVVRPVPVSRGLAGALCGYVVLFGPLALFPQVLGTQGTARLVVTCLPAGFGAACLTAEWILPARLGHGARASAGALACALGSIALIAFSRSAPAAGALLLLIGGGLGVFIPANTTSIMAAIPGPMAATGGSLVNMTRGFGTALAVALVTLCLHAGRARGPDLALAMLALAAIGAVVTGLSWGLRGQPARQEDPA